MSNEQRLDRWSYSRRPAGEQPTDQQFTNRRGYSRRNAVAPRFTEETVVNTEPCGGCGEEEADYTVEYAGMELASHFQIKPFCDGDLTVTFEYDADGTYVGTDGGAPITCNGGATTLTFVLQIDGDAPGDVYITATDGIDTWRWETDACYEPTESRPMVRVSGPQFCPCGRLKTYFCLQQIPAALAA